MTPPRAGGQQLAAAAATDRTEPADAAQPGMQLERAASGTREAPGTDARLTLIAAFAAGAALLTSACTPSALIAERRTAAVAFRTISTPGNPTADNIQCNTHKRERFPDRSVFTSWCHYQPGDYGAPHVSKVVATYSPDHSTVTVVAGAEDGSRKALIECRYTRGATNTEWTYSGGVHRC